MPAAEICRACPKSCQTAVRASSNRPRQRPKPPQKSRKTPKEAPKKPPRPPRKAPGKCRQAGRRDRGAGIVATAPARKSLQCPGRRNPRRLPFRLHEVCSGAGSGRGARLPGRTSRAVPSCERGVNAASGGTKIPAASGTSAATAPRPRQPCAGTRSGAAAMLPRGLFVLRSAQQTSAPLQRRRSAAAGWCGAWPRRRRAFSFGLRGSRPVRGAVKTSRRRARTKVRSAAPSIQAPRFQGHPLQLLVWCTCRGSAQQVMPEDRGGAGGAIGRRPPRAPGWWWNQPDGDALRNGDGGAGANPQSPPSTAAEGARRAQVTSAWAGAGLHRGVVAHRALHAGRGVPRRR